MGKNEFINQLSNDEDLMNQLPLIATKLNDKGVLDEIYVICRKAYETQLSADIFRTEDGVGYQIHEVHFKEFAKDLNNFFQLFNDEKEELYKESLILLDKYYKETATDEESKSRATLDKNPKNQGYGHVGTLYFFDTIDWNYFDKMLTQYL